jgi:hypothetical protein
LHLSQIRAQRVSGRRDGGNRGVASRFGGLPRILRQLSKRLTLLSHGLQLLAVLLTERPGLFGEGPKLFRLFSRRFRVCPVGFGAVALLIRFFAQILS